MTHFGILGAGSWAIALAKLLHEKNHRITLWEFNPDEAALLKEKREHPRKLPGIAIDPAIGITTDLAETLRQATHIICAVPAQSLRKALATVASTCADTYPAIQGWIIVSKGIECTTTRLMSEVLCEELPQVPQSRIAVLSGPSHAEEVSRNIPTTVVAAASDESLTTWIQNAFSTSTFRVYTNPDMTGVELAGSVKNVIAIAAGICDGLGFGDNTKGALLTRGIAEMMRLGEKMGATRETFSGLTGMGDLITTCISKHSRNRNLGELIGSGKSLEDALGSMVMVAEGVQTTKAVRELARRYQIEMPITEQIYCALFENKSPLQATRDLMLRETKPEYYW